MVSLPKLFVLQCIFYHKLHLGSRMCKVIVVKSDDSIIIGKLQLVLRMCRGIMHNCIYIYIYTYKKRWKENNNMTANVTQ